MKSQAKLLFKFFSLAILISCFAVGLYAQKKHSNLLVLNSEISKLKTSAKINYDSQMKLSTIDNREIIEEKQKLETWMFDSTFWQIVKKNEGNVEISKKQSLAEDWISIFNLQNRSCTNSDFVEKDWMKEHCFFIL